MRELKQKVVEAEADPWAFFKSHALRDLQRACHPDCWPGRHVEATDLFTRFTSAYERAQTTVEVLQGRYANYRMLRHVTTGDLRAVWDVGKSQVLKVPRISGKATDRLVRREVDLLQQLRGSEYSRYSPRIIDSFTSRQGLCVVTDYPDRLVTASHIRRVFADRLDGRHVAWMCNRILEALGAVHAEGWCHNAVTPDHFMLAPETHAGVLVGWIHAEQPGFRIRTVPGTWKNWYPPDAQQGASPAVDVYMAGRLILYLIGDGEIHPRIRTFLKATQLPAGLRPADAWQLREDFGDLLEGVYGTPRFVELSVEQEDYHGWNDVE